MLQNIWIGVLAFYDPRHGPNNPKQPVCAEDGSFRGDLQCANQNIASAGAQKCLNCTSGATQSQIKCAK